MCTEARPFTQGLEREIGAPSFDANHGSAKRLDQVFAGGAYGLGVLALDRHLDLVLGRGKRRVAADLDGGVGGDDAVELMGDVPLLRRREHLTQVERLVAEALADRLELLA